MERIFYWELFCVADCIFGEWLAPGTFPTRGGGFGYFEHSPFFWQFEASNAVSANASLVGFIRSRDYNLGLFPVTVPCLIKHHIKMLYASTTQWSVWHIACSHMLCDVQTSLLSGGEEGLSKKKSIPRFHICLLEVEIWETILQVILVAQNLGGKGASIPGTSFLVGK